MAVGEKENCSAYLSLTFVHNALSTPLPHAAFADQRSPFHVVSPAASSFQMTYSLFSRTIDGGKIYMYVRAGNNPLKTSSKLCFSKQVLLRKIGLINKYNSPLCSLFLSRRSYINRKCEYVTKDDKYFSKVLTWTSSFSGAHETDFFFFFGWRWICSSPVSTEMSEDS